MASGGTGKKVVGRLTIRVSPDMDGFRGEVERGANEAARDTNPEVKVDADTTRAKSKIKELEDDRGRIDLDVDADTAKAKAEIAEATRPRKVNIKVDYDESSLDRIRQTARAAERELSKIGSNPDRGKSGLSLLGGALGSKIGGFSFPDLVPNIGGLGGAGSIGIIVAGLSLVAPALALLSQALVGLPALITAVALPIGVVALGFKGIKDALDSAGLLDIITGKSKKDGTKGKDKNEPGEIIKDLQGKISDTFKTGLTPVFQQMAAALPALTRGLPFVAQGLVKMAEGFGNILATPAFQQGFDRLTNSIGTMLTNLSPALQLFTSGMMNLITNVGDHLPGLGNKMTEWAGQFQNWVDRISKPQNFWGKDVPNSSTLDKAVHNIGPELDSLFGSIGNLINRGLDLAGKGDIAKGIQDAITGLGDLLTQLSRLGPVFESIASILNAVPGLPTGFDPKTPYGTKPGPAGSNTTVPITHDEAMQQKVGFVDDPVQWIGDQAKGFLGHMFDGAKKFVTEQTIGGVLLSSLFGGGSGPGGTAGADTSPFNPGTKVGQTPIPVTPVGPAGGSPALNNLLLPQTTPQPVPGVSGIGAAGTPLQAPKVEAPKAPDGADQIWQPLVAATQKAGADIGQEVDSWSGKIKSALDSAAAGANASGVAIGTQMAAGIAAGAPSAIEAARALAQGVKDVLPHSPAKDPNSPFGGSKWGEVKSSGKAIASSFADGLTDGFDGVVSSSKRLMDAVHGSMDQNGILPPQLTAAVQRESQAIGIELDRLKAQRDALDPKDKSGRAAIKAQMDQLRGLKDEFGLTGKESKYNSKYGGAGGADGPFTAQNVGQQITSQIAAGLNGALGFGKANLGQFEQDLGMSGNGVVEQLGDYGINFLSSGLNSLVSGFFGGGQNGQSGSTYNFHSMDHDGMMQNYDRVKNRESMAYTQRSN